MPAPNKTASTVLDEHIEQTKELFSETQPTAINWLSQQKLTIQEIRSQSEESVSAQVQRVAAQQSRATQVTSEEQSAIIRKLIDWAQKPPCQLSGNDALYLEQQLSDLIGIDVVTVLENIQLPHNTGVMQATPHLKRYPEDTLDQHSAYKEASMQARRSSLGWFTPHSSDNATTLEKEAYSVSIQLHYLEAWQSNRQFLKKWYKFRKVLVVNPFEQLATVATIANIGPQERLQYQFAGSPEIIRETAVWSLKTQGKILLFFIDDPENTVALGPVPLQLGGK